MKNLLLLLGHLLLSVLVFGQNSTVTFTYGGVQRTYNVHLPTGYTSGQHLPLVLNLHGYGQTNSQQELYTNMNATADANSFVVIYPAGLNNSWNIGAAGVYHFGTDDVGFLSKVIDTAQTLYGIDPKRVYACGLSNGGYMSHRLACELSDKVAAIAAVAGCLTDSMAYYCNATRKVPVMQIHGTADPIVPYTGAVASLSTEETVAFWASFDLCGTTSDTTNLPNTDATDGCTVQKIDYPNCADNSRVLLYKIINGGHTWPNGTINVPTNGNTDRDIDANTEIWNFFKQYTLDGNVGINQPVPSEQQIQIFPNPANQTITVQMRKLPNTVANIYTLNGRLAKSAPLSNSQTIPTQDLPNGVYLLQITNGQQPLANKKLVVMH